MESSLRHNRRRSGYEPSDTETDWHDSPRRETDNNSYDQGRSQSPLSSVSRLKQSTILEMDATRRHSKSPYKTRGEKGNVPSDFRRNVSPLSRRTYSNIRRNVSPLMVSQRRTNQATSGNACPFSQSERRTNPDSNRENISLFPISERRRHISPYKTAGEDYGQTNHDMSKGRERSSYSRRAASAPRARSRERGQQINYDGGEQKFPQEEKEVSHKHGPSVGEINEMVANAKLARGLNGHVPNLESTDSISPGDIFFSRDYNAFKNVVFRKNGSADPRTFIPKPPGGVDRNPGSHQGIKVNASFNHNTQAVSQITTNSSSAASRQSSNVSESSGRTNASTRNFIANRRKSQSDAWFSCIKKGSCTTSHKSPEKGRPFDEASFIEKAIVVESLRPLWADKHQPASLIGFTCHKQEAQLLMQLATSEIFPHILLKGPPGTGKKALTMALLREMYGDPVWNISHDLRYFHILESRPTQVVVPLSSSPHQVELNVYLEPKAAYALTALVKQISNEYVVTPEISAAPTKADYKVLVLYDVDKAAENIHHLIKWIMDCYSDSCKLILCCEDDVDILESVKSRCKVIKVEAPVTHEVMEVLIQIAKKEGFDLSMSFAAKIATKSKQNLRRAIMALEACKAHNYPFLEDQPITLGWEEALVELAADILADPMPKRLFSIRGKIQKLLGDFVHPKLILLKLVEQFLRGVEASLKRELYYWYAYYDKRLPSGTNALLKLEEFVAKFMSIYRKSWSNRQSS
ncbi:Replication factor C, subunit RFC3 [Handroanthus impetiginosus]|uniref:Replication factor C, subunit RFC3 n=1 Tax=Handroanthus impetiginosus TaxID=429701 RepID=A0A2G9HH47_9LAMI|nr:Replication factor C, subunit RFC3 [Handroanthus impetiginosus]